MARGELTFRQTDVTRALKAAKQAGVEIARIEISKDGKIVLVVGAPETAEERKSSWDNDWSPEIAKLRRANPWDEDDKPDATAKTLTYGAATKLPHVLFRGGWRFETTDKKISRILPKPIGSEKYMNAYRACLAEIG